MHFFFNFWALKIAYQTKKALKKALPIRNVGLKSDLEKLQVV